jgi:hypothetical protein
LSKTFGKRLERAPSAFSGRDAIEFAFEIALAAEANDLIGNLSAAEYQKRGDGTDAILGGQSLVLIDIDFADLDPPVVFRGEFIEDRRDHLTGAAPFRPEIDENGHGGLEDFLVKIAIGESDNVRC